MTKSTIRHSRILVVDDDPFVGDSIRMLLTFDGHAVTTAINAEEALRRFDPGEIDVLITDYAMPGMVGAELAKAVRRRAPGLPVILVTAYAEMLDSWGADLSEVDCVVSKPFRLEDLRRALGKVPHQGTLD
jgi:CheY-like chemotaxis protein